MKRIVLDCIELLIMTAPVYVLSNSIYKLARVFGKPLSMKLSDAVNLKVVDACDVREGRRDG